MKNQEYRLARIIIVIVFAIGCSIAFINEDISVKVAGTLAFTAVAYFVSLLVAPICRKVIAKGDGIANKWIRVLYYLGIFVGLATVALLIYLLILSADHVNRPGVSLSEALSRVIILLFVGIAFCVAAGASYLEMLIVLIVRKVMAKSGKESK